MKILIVDDEKLIRRALKRAAESLGHETLEAEDALKGEKTWLKLKPDLVFLDICMPGLSGPELLKKIKGQHKAKVILMSAFKDGYNWQKDKTPEAHLFLPKPFEDIFETIKLAEKLCS